MSQQFSREAGDLMATANERSHEAQRYIGDQKRTLILAEYLESRKLSTQPNLAQKVFLKKSLMKKLLPSFAVMVACALEVTRSSKM